MRRFVLLAALWCTAAPLVVRGQPPKPAATPDTLLRQANDHLKKSELAKDDRQKQAELTEAAKDLRAVLVEFPTHAKVSEIKLTLAVCLLESARAAKGDEAVKLLKEADELNAGGDIGAVAVYRLGVARTEGEPVGATAAFERFLKDFPKHALAKEVAVRLAELLPQKEAKRVIELLRPVTGKLEASLFVRIDGQPKADDPDSPLVLRAAGLLAEALRATGEKEEARQWVRQIVMLVPKTPDGLAARCRLAVWLAEDGKFAEAVKEATDAATADAESGVPVAAEVVGLLLAKAPEEAIKLATDVLTMAKVPKTWGELTYYRGVARQSLQRLDEAVADFDAARKLELAAEQKKDVEARAAQCREQLDYARLLDGKKLLADGKPADAAKVMDGLAADSPNGRYAAEANFQAGRAHALLRDATTARKRFDAASTDPAFAELAMLAAANQALALNEPADARNRFQAAEQKFPKSPRRQEVALGLGCCLQLEKKHAEAEEAFAAIVGERTTTLSEAAAQFHTAECLEARRQVRHAATAYANASVYPFPVVAAPAHLRAATLYASLGEPTSARLHFEHLTGKEFAGTPEAAEAEKWLKSNPK